jgi:hypothetical protein
VFLEVGCPVDFGDGYPNGAAHERGGGIERHFCRMGEHHHIDAGDRLTGVGVQWVGGFAEATVNGVRVANSIDFSIEQAWAKLIPSGAGPCSTGHSQTSFPTV